LNGVTVKEVQPYIPDLDELNQAAAQNVETAELVLNTTGQQMDIFDSDLNVELVGMEYVKQVLTITSDLVPMFTPSKKNQKSESKDGLVEIRQSSFDKNITYKITAAVMKNSEGETFFEKPGELDKHVLQAIRTIAESRGFVYYNGTPLVLTSHREIMRTVNRYKDRIRLNVLIDSLNRLAGARIETIIRNKNGRETTGESTYIGPVYRDMSLEVRQILESPEIVPDAPYDSTDVLLIGLNQMYMNEIRTKILPKIDRALLEKCKTLSATILSLMTQKFKNATTANNSYFEIDAIQVREASGMMQLPKNHQSTIHPVVKALDELISLNQIRSYEGRVVYRQGPRKKIKHNTIYRVYPTAEFVRSQIINNAEMRDKRYALDMLRKTMSEEGYPVPKEGIEIGFEKLRDLTLEYYNQKRLETLTKIDDEE